MAAQRAAVSLFMTDLRYTESGDGVAASLLAENGIAVFSEKQIDELIAWIEEREGKK
jgi:uncharacterized protein YbbK (DUF523 family)